MSFCLPFIGPLLGIVLFLLVPVEPLNRLWWSAVLLEPMWLVGLYGLVTLGLPRRSDNDEAERV